MQQRGKIVQYIGFFVGFLAMTNCFLMQKNYELALEYKDEIIETREKTIEDLELAYFNKETNYYYESTNAYNVIFTNYYTGDSDGSTNKTGSQLTTDMFGVNEKGWYTYNGKVVIATATWKGIESNYGSLANIHDVPSGYHIFHYGDTFKFVFDGIEYEGIVLDTCSACMVRKSGEDYQRFDIFVANESYTFGKRVGMIYE